MFRARLLLTMLISSLGFNLLAQTEDLERLKAENNDRRKEAQTQRALAETAAREAMRWRHLYHGHIAAEQSILAENDTLAALLAVQGYNFIQHYGGNPSDATILRALAGALNRFENTKAQGAADTGTKSMTAGEMATALCGRVNRNMTSAEWSASLKELPYTQTCTRFPPKKK